MRKLRSFLQLMAIAMLLSTTTAQQYQVAKPGCNDRCGEIIIPYPFGLSPDCSFHSLFHIICDNTSNPPKPFLAVANHIDIRAISLDGKVEIMQNVTKNCYTNESTPIYAGVSFIGYLGKFTISDTDNVFATIGCDTQLLVRGFVDDVEGYDLGCISNCLGSANSLTDSCPGVGCCETPLPVGVREYNIRLTSSSNYTRFVNYSPCSYTFIMEKTKFNYSAANLKDLPTVEKLPMIAEWTIGDDNCSSVNQTTSLCQGNSVCRDPYNKLSGYRCLCSPGYQGNPYLPDGCQDIDECQNSTFNQCQRNCVNTPGSYTCTCPKGYHGDGRKDGQGCIADRSILTYILVGCSIGMGIPLLVVTTWLLYRIVKRRNEKKQREEFFKRNGGLLMEQQVSSGDGVEMAIKIFRSKELERVTDNYNENRILGRGGQGTVYKGMLEDGRIVAIKKSKLIDTSQLDQFINEVVILQQINHRNIVKLLGCCLETEVPMLVYEFIPNGMLSHHLHDQNEEFLMTWNMRLQIAIEVADGLSYLHSAASNPIYHCDIKSANILLDEKYRAKIADFGISRSIDLDQTHLTTPNVQGTFGYLDPEYYRTSQFTEKSDVYSFGVVLVELLTGQKPISMARSENERSLANYFLLAIEEDRLFEIVDPRVLKEAPEEAIAAIAKLSQRCLHMTGRKRPTMREVLTELQGIRRSKEFDINKQNDEFDTENYNITGSWEATSTSSTSFLGNGTQSLSIDIEPLLSTRW